MKYFYNDVRNSLSGKKLLIEKQKNLLGYYLYRVPSFIVTPIFIKLGFSASAVTGLSILCIILIPISVIKDNPGTIFYVAGLGFLFHLFDHIDGNIARVTKSSSNKGQLLDMISGVFYWIIFYLSIGAIVDKYPIYSLDYFQIFYCKYIYIAFSIIMIDLFSRLISLYQKANFEQGNDLQRNIFGLKQYLISFFISFKRLSPLLIIIFALFNSLDLYLIIMFLYSIFGFNYILYTSFRKF